MSPPTPETKNDTDHGHELPSSTSASGPGDEKDLAYVTPLRLTMIMCTLSLSTLIAALDLVSLPTVLPRRALN